MHLFLRSRSERGGARRAPTKRVDLKIVMPVPPLPFLILCEWHEIKTQLKPYIHILQSDPSTGDSLPPSLFSGRNPEPSVHVVFRKTWWGEHTTASRGLLRGCNHFRIGTILAVRYCRRPGDQSCKILRKQGVPDRAVIDTTWIREISYMYVTWMS